MDQQWRQRRQRIRRWLRPLPRKANVHRYPVVKWFSAFIHKKPELWSFKNASVVRAIYLGCILAYLPSYGAQILLACIVAFFARANLTVMVALQMITNPLTAAPIYIATYTIGNKLITVFHLGVNNLIFDGALALIYGGLSLGLMTALLLHGLWILGRYEAERFRLKRQSAGNTEKS
jgi:uncharacterized protein (DUF2062 family)